MKELKTNDKVNLVGGASDKVLSDDFSALAVKSRLNVA